MQPQNFLCPELTPSLSARTLLDVVAIMISALQNAEYSGLAPSVLHLSALQHGFAGRSLPRGIPAVGLLFFPLAGRPAVLGFAWFNL